MTNQYPIGASLTLADFAADTHPILHQLRSKEPVSWVPVLNAWLVTSRANAVSVMRDAKTYTVDHPGFSTAQVVGPSMLSLDGAEHVRHRSPFERPFRRGSVEIRFNDVVTKTIRQLLDEIEPLGRAELRRTYAGPIAVKTMMTALGLVETSVSVVLDWYDTIVEAVTQVTMGQPVSKAGRAAFAALRRELLPVLKHQPDSSLLAAASGLASGLSNDQIVSNAAVLLFGGIETTEGMIANAFYHLLTHPNVLRQVSENPALLPAVIEESLRLEPAASVIDRYATSDVQLGQAHLKSGDLVRVSLAAANRDPDIFVNPDQFDPQRANLQSHVTWAQGPHVCLGLHLARLEAQEAIAEAISRWPYLRFDGNADVVLAAKPQGLVFRKPVVLPVAWAG